MIKTTKLISSDRKRKESFDYTTLHRGQNLPSSPSFRASLFGTFLSATFLLCSGSAFAAVNTTCDQAAELAAKNSSVPLSVLRAVTRNETGRKRSGQTEPWPWTVNMEGDSFWFDTLDQAKAFVFEKFKSGARSFDVGCFQINYKWHGSAFGSIEEMFDPTENALYAARFLEELYSEKQDWLEAVGAFHSRTEEYAERYKKNYQTILASLEAFEMPLAVVAKVPHPRERQNNFPLLTPGSVKTVMGSLVPLNTDRSATSLILPEG